jgi:hypothetical protein
MEDKGLDQFVEDVALFWESQGVPRIAGRIFGLLLICEPPFRSASQIADELGVSKGSVSSMTRLLLETGSIETVAVPGERGRFFGLTPDGLERKLERRVQSMVSFRGLAERGLELVEPNRGDRLRRVVSLYAFMERELPLLIAKWRAEQKDGVGS